uniref:CC2D2A N-terminal C2 domain-containing protein n=1 Tax=Panagrolaimus sp. JU765 TaxID=591449 RepID=A0AC34R1M6_9BILA
MLTTFGRKKLENQVEAPFDVLQTVFSAASQRDFSVFLQREGSNFENAKDAIDKLRTIVTDRPLREIKLPEIHEQWQQFFEDLPFFFIENLDERKPLKNKIQVLIFFNEILVCKTLAVPLQSDFSVQFGKVYQLRIYEPPNEIFLMIREFQPVKGWVEISRVFLPLPSSVEDQHSDLEQAEFASEIVVEKTTKYLGCGMANKESPHLNGKVFYNLKWKEKVGQTNQKVPSRRKKEEDVDLPFQLIPPELRLVSDEEFASDARLDALTKRFARSTANLPERVDKGLMHVLVEAEFQGNKSQTLTVSGKNANWQQTLTLNIEMSSNGQLDLRTVVDHLELNIYDQQIRKLPHDNREPNTVHEQLEKRWLGTCSIPFSTIYSFGKVNGVVAIKEPLFSNEYKLFKHRAFLKVMITLDPPIIPPNFSNYDNFLPYESSEILAECQRFMTKNSQLFPDRRFVCLVNDTSGKRLLATRFLRKILPPQHVHEMLSNSGNIRAAIQLAAHMVSCIPFVADPVMFPGVCDLWTTAEQLLAIGSGDEEEHAILLVCWLMFLNVSAVLILGHGLPEGSKAAYILVQTESDSFLVNPSDGNVYSLNDSMCPLIS